MELDKRDVVTGRPTTGHEWNGIEELETPIPRVVFFFLGTAFLFSLICWMLYPTWPLIWTYSKGLLGTDQKRAVALQMENAVLSRETWTSEIEKKSYAEIEADPALMRSVKETGRTLFGDNCAACHGVNAIGGAGFPNLTAKAWLWGNGSPEALEETIRIGINSTNDDTRTSQMLAFGHDDMLPAEQIEAVVAYVRSLSGLEPAGNDAKRIETGKRVFATNCVACHGEDAKGNRDVGAPDLTDANWLYGGDRQTVFTTVYSGRQGHMPNWAVRLSPLDIKILTVYVHTLEKKPQ